MQLNGNYTIDPSGTGPTNYTTWGAVITAPGAGVSGNVVFTVSSTTFNETVTISPITGTSATATVTFGLLAGERHRTVSAWIEQLVSRGFLRKTGEYAILECLNLFPYTIVTNPPQAPP